MPRKQPMTIVMLGPQGSGKGTQAAMLADRFVLRHLESGDLLRRAAKRRTAIGTEINRLVNEQGRLVPDAIVLELLQGAIGRIPTSSGIILDGYPRTLAQARALEKLLADHGRTVTHAFYLPIAQATTIRRLASRRTCRRCGRIYIAGKNISRTATRCPRCGGEVYRRPDDTRQAIIQRLREYHRRTMPVVRYYRKRNALITVNGEGSIRDVARTIISTLREWA